MPSFFAIAAIAVAAMFTGAAFYINFAEHPARMKLATAEALAQWKPSYQRGFLMQASLAVIAALLAVGAFVFDLDWRWLLGGALMAANWPYTLTVLMPLNKRLMAIAPEAADENVRVLLGQWNLLHAVRTCLGAAGLIAMGFAAQS